MMYGRPDTSDQTIAVEFNEQFPGKLPIDHTAVGK
jgi:hypothetical protein